LKFFLTISIIILVTAWILLRRPIDTQSPYPILIATPSPPQLIYIENVPFVSQAPFGDWKDPRQQDGCEESAVLLAVMWAKNQTLTKEEALNYILAIATYEKDTYGSFTDTSTKDTENRIVRGYFHYDQSQIVNLHSISDIIAPLTAGKLVIVPTNGQLLHNPNFTNAGPERHNLVIRGYDSSTHEFITNDPGTRKGENYRYPEDVLFNAIRDYPTGQHLQIIGNSKTAIIVWK
jgi:hypothetical protein